MDHTPLVRHSLQTVVEPLYAHSSHPLTKKERIGEEVGMENADRAPVLFNHSHILSTQGRHLGIVPLYPLLLTCQGIAPLLRIEPNVTNKGSRPPLRNRARCHKSRESYPLYPQHIMPPSSLPWPRSSSSSSALLVSGEPICTCPHPVGLH